MDKIYLPHLKWIESQLETMLNLVEKWSSINSYSLNIKGLPSFISHLSEHFNTLNATVKEIPLPKSVMIDELGNSVHSPPMKMLSAKKREELSQSILFMGHADTVFPPESPFQSTAQKAENLLNGPGVADMKGGLVVMLFALAAFERSPLSEKLGWEILINPDEEIGSIASTPIIEEKAAAHQFSLVFEPSLPDGSFINERGGSLNFALISKGTSSHAGRDFFSGKNAILPLTSLLDRIADFTNEKEGITSNVAYIHGGDALNVVPSTAVAKVNIRFQTKEQIKRLESAVQSFIPPGIEYRRLSYRPPKPFDEKTKKLFDRFKECADDLNLPFICRSSRGVCDGNTLAAAGLPTIDTLGVIGGGIHTEEEYLLIPSLVERAKLVCLFLMRFANGEFHDL